MFCAISGEVPQEPVVAKTTGLLFEKRIILQALKLEKKCPVTNTDLSEEDLLPIAANPIPPLRVAAPTNVNGLLHTLQQEWDETVLETFNLRQQLDTTRRELSHALYQYDAACRVIARLVKERDEAFNLLKTYQLNGYVAATNGEGSSQPQQSTAETEEAMDVVQTEVGISPEIVNELNALCKQLSSGRKQRKPSEHLTTKDQMAQLHEVGQYAPHKNAITAVAVKASSDNNSNLVLSGSADSSVVLSDLDSGKVHCKLNGHRGVVNTVAFSPVSTDTLFSGSDDKTVRIWHAGGEGNYTQRYQLAHQSAVTGLTVQPSGNYLVTTAESGNWNVFDVKNGILLKSVADVDNTQYKTCCFHPDGLILGTGTKQGSFKIWDIREQKEVTTLKESDGSIQSISFSENGYFTATGHSNGEVIIWDLRKLAKVKSFNVGSSPVNSVSFDYSGVYLGIGGGGIAGSQLEVKVVKDWSSLVTIPNAHNAEVTGIAWTNHAGSLVSASVDQTIRVFGK